MLIKYPSPRRILRENIKQACLIIASIILIIGALDALRSASPTTDWVTCYGE